MVRWWCDSNLRASGRRRALELLGLAPSRVTQVLSTLSLRATSIGDRDKALRRVCEGGLLLAPSAKLLLFLAPPPLVVRFALLSMIRWEGWRKSGVRS